MKLQTTVIDQSTIEREVYTRPEFRQIKVDIDNAGIGQWLQITGFEKKEELGLFVTFARRGHSCIQQSYKKKGIRLEIKTDVKKLIVEICKTIITPEELSEMAAQSEARRAKRADKVIEYDSGRVVTN